MKFLAFLGKLLTEIGAQIWGMFCGRDKKLSGRKFWGSVVILSGIGISWQFKNNPMPVDVIQLVWNMSGVIIIAIGAFIWGFVTWQNIKDIASAKKDL